MKNSMAKIAMAMAVAGIAFSANATSLKTQQDKLSYAMGAETGKAFKMHNIAVNVNAYMAGLQDASQGKKLQMSDQQIQTVLTQFQKKAIKKMQSKLTEEGMKNQQLGAAFLATNKTKPGVVTTPSGLQYKIVKQGHGPKPSKNAIVTVDYEGKLINGQVFDSSYKRGRPATFPVTGVIQGWQEALQMMHRGATWMVYIPPKLAYGAQGVPGGIGPNETLIFKVHLISIKGN